MHNQYKLYVLFLCKIFNQTTSWARIQSKYYATYALRHLVFKTHIMFKQGSTVLSVLTIRHYAKYT